MYYSSNKFVLYLFLFISVVIPRISNAQIQGSILDLNNKPLSFANVLLLYQKDSTIVSGVMATEEGTYNLTNFKPGNYILGVKMLGYKPTFSSPFEISNSNVHIHNEAIFVEENSQQLDDIDVVAKKPLYELKIDRMVVNVENSVTSAGNTALEVLEKSPGVIVDRQNYGLSLSGKSGVIVMINGKQNRMPISAAVQMLDAMSADNVKRIELITTPPAKYDAEGDAGIINIVLKKNDAFGTNGSFTLGAGYATHERFNGNLNLNHHAEKVNYFGLYNASYNNGYSEIFTNRKINQSGSILETDAKSFRDPHVIFQNVRFGIDYTVSSKTVLGVLFTGYLRNWENEAINEIYYSRDDDIFARSEMETVALNRSTQGMVNINLRHNFKEDDYLDINFDYLHHNINNPSYYKVKNIDEEGNSESGEEIDSEKETPINIYVGMIDYTNQLSPKVKLEVGVKSTFSNFLNDVSVSYLNSGVWEISDELTNEYWLKENVSAVYSSVSYKLNEKTSLVAGLRYEYLNSVLSSATEHGIVDLHYGKLFPTFYLSRKLNENNTVQFAYSRRIDRPTFNQLAPFVLLLTPETFVKGNVSLVPAFSSIVKADYQFKSIMFTLSYTETKDAISRFQPKIDEEENIQYISSSNIDSRKNFSAMLAFPINVTEWWRMQNNVSWVKYKIVTGYEGQNLDIENSSYRFNSIQTLDITKRLSLEFSGFYQSLRMNGIVERKPFGKVDIGLQMKFKNESSRLNLNFSDVFKTNVIRSSANVPELNIDTNNRLYFGSRRVMLTFSHNFGSTTVKAARKRKTGGEEESKRIGG